jgi:4-nitrophenyl phosphatase
MTRHVCYKQLAIANHLINQGADFIGTNPDVTFPSEFGLMPGAGSILAFLETSSGITPTVIGKPNAVLFEEALHRLPGTVRDTVMVGDRINTDVLGALSLGLRTILLLSGISNREELDDSDVIPDWVFEDLLSLTNALATDLPVSGLD